MEYGNETILYELFESSDVSGRIVDFDPFILLPDGEKFNFQRGYVWNLKDKQSLINSIYEGSHCGGIVCRVDLDYRLSVIDGKQRANALHDFVLNKFKDNNGYYFGDLSNISQGKFLTLQSFSFNIMNHTATDLDVIKQFLKVNVAGVKVDKSHLNKVAEAMKKLES